MMKKTSVLFLFLIFVSCDSGAIKQTNPDEITPALLADNFITIHPDTIAYPTEAKSYKWNYEQGLILEALYRVWAKTKQRKYFDYIKKNIDYYVEEDGTIKTYVMNSFNIDNIAPGRILLRLYEATKEAKYKMAADSLMAQLMMHPRTSEGGFWHKKIYPNQMWLDGLYMAEPFYSEYSVMFNQPDNFDDITKQFLLIKKHLRDSATGLYYHGWDESRKQAWADSIKGTSPNFWGRSLGWFMMALVDVLDVLPENHKNRNEILTIFQELSVSLLNYRDEETALWYQVTDQPNKEGNYIETSSSSMFIYAFAKGYNKKYLEEKFLTAAKQSFRSLIESYLIKDVNGNYLLTNVCSVGGLGGNPYRDGSFDYYISEPKRDNDFKGYGPLLLASLEISQSTGK